MTFPSGEPMTSLTLNSLWTVKSGSLGASRWQVIEQLDRNGAPWFRLRLVWIDPSVYNAGYALGEDIEVELAWFVRRGEQVAARDVATVNNPR